MKDKRNRHGAVGKIIIFGTIFSFKLPLLCEISTPSGRWQGDELQVNFENFKVGCRSK